jgi:hypothetical protein
MGQNGILSQGTFCVWLDVEDKEKGRKHICVQGHLTGYDGEDK